jgi:hypothetical protein
MFQPTIEAAPPLQLSRLTPRRSRRLVSTAAGWASHGFFWVLLGTGVVILPVSLLALIGRMILTG